MLKKSKELAKWLYRFMASKELTMALFAALCLFLAVTTFTEEDNTVVWDIISVLLALTALALSLCTIQRIKTLPVPVIIIHIGMVLTLIGGGISSYGFVATVNIYEGTAQEKVYRWDIEKDVSLGFDIYVKKLYEEYYPVPIKVGVRKNGEKKNLYHLWTGDSFDMEGYIVQVDSIDISSKSLELSIFNDGEYIGHANTLGKNDITSSFPYDFKLVAYIDPVIKRTWVDLALLKGNEIVTEGRTEINSPLNWNGMNFYHTETNRDKYGNPFIGIQITRDPGLIYVYLGFSIVAFGGVWYLVRRFCGRS